MGERLTELTDDHRARVESVLLEHGRFIEAVANRCAPNYVDVQDVVQEVSIRLCQSLHTFDGRANIRTWLFAITRNCAVSLHRREVRNFGGEEIQRGDMSRSLGDAMAASEHTFSSRETEIERVPADIDIEADFLEREREDGQRRLAARGFREALTVRQREAVRHFLSPARVSEVGPSKSAMFRARDRMRRWVTEHRDDELTPVD